MWSLGVALYTMMLAAHPWGASTTNDLYDKVLHEPCFFPNNAFIFSPPAKLAIGACLAREPDQRPSADALWELPFFASSLPPTNAVGPLTRDEVEGKLAVPPFLPTLRGPFDTHYFEEAEFSDDGEEDAVPFAGTRRREQSPLANDGDTRSEVSSEVEEPRRYMVVEQPDGEQRAGVLLDGLATRGRDDAMRSGAAPELPPEATNLANYTTTSDQLSEDASL